jgi:hypothetical protein
VWSGEKNGAAGPSDAMELLHGGHDVVDMFDDVLGAKLIEGIVGKGKTTFVEIAQNIGGGGCIHIQTDGTGIFCRAAADV